MSRIGAYEVSHFVEVQKRLDLVIEYATKLAGYHGRAVAANSVAEKLFQITRGESDE